MDEALSRLGIEEADLDEVVLAWTPRQSPERSAAADAPKGEKMEGADGRIDLPPTELSGLVAGRFDPVRISEHAAKHGLAPLSMGEVQAYCPRLKAASVCFVVLNESLAAFGEPEALKRLLDARAGTRNTLAADPRFSGLMSDVNKYAPIWGVATGATVSEWFLGWMPEQAQGPVDLKKTFDSVQAFTYSIEANEKFELTARLTGESTEAAQQLQQLFSGFRILLSLFWQAQFPSQPNPFAGLEISTDQRVCALKLTGTIEQVLLFQPSPTHTGR